MSKERSKGVSQMQNEVWSYRYDAEGNGIEEDVPLIVGPGGCGTLDAHESRLCVPEPPAWYETDRLGSVPAQPDANEPPLDTITYDGFGNVLDATDAAER